MNKARLIQALEQYDQERILIPGLPEPPQHPRTAVAIDDPIRDINVPVLKPTPAVNPNSLTRQPKSLKSMANKAATAVKNQISKFADWISSYIPHQLRLL